ncbi:hypothetical protein U1Q18_015330 [Sarracenia purpurea var. burkii]
MERVMELPASPTARVSSSRQEGDASLAPKDSSRSEGSDECQAFGHDTSKCKASKKQDDEGWIQVGKGKGKVSEVQSGGPVQVLPSSSNLTPCEKLSQRNAESSGKTLEDQHQTEAREPIAEATGISPCEEVQVMANVSAEVESSEKAKSPVYDLSMIKPLLQFMKTSTRRSQIRMRSALHTLQSLA